MDSEDSDRDRGAGVEVAGGERSGVEPTEEQRGAQRLAARFFTLSMLAGIGLFVVYFSGGQTQVEGILFAIALGALGIGIGLWAHHLLDAREAIEDRHELSSGPEARQAFEEALGEEVGPAIRRRGMLLGLLAGAGGALGLALLLPLISLGPAPGDTLKRTAWHSGRRVVDEEGRLLTLDSVPEDGFVTVYPEGAVGRADSQALLIRVPRGLLRLPPERMAAVPEGSYVCYSKLCTHAGCPIGLYRVEQQTNGRSLFCPCHQSQFDVLDSAKPFFGPAARPLPQLPLRIDNEGHLAAEGDFFEPVGPAFWDRSK
ncbi:MAG: Rieske (2Fe-2S) protein [Sporichthyaceae bacterium]|nr:Rieske (2Fe-2S) protein [Sporichthyaceae bacterium]